MYKEQKISIMEGAARESGTPFNDYRTHLSYEMEDSAWDTFVQSTPGGHHVQTCLWAQLKASQGWQAIRLIVTRDGEIVAGAQLLLFSLRAVGIVAYGQKAPLFATNDPRLEEYVVGQLQELARTHGIQLLVVQPPSDGRAIIPQLAGQGFAPSRFDIGPTATTLIDLEQELDDILAGMKSGTRYNVRLGRRKGIEVWEGTEGDFDRYYEILSQTSKRQGFTIYSKDYFIKMWRLLNPHGFIKLFLAGLDGEIVSGQLAVPFRDTVVNKLSVWSGRHGDRRPNEVLQWSTIKWAKAHGYRYYDFEGIDPEAAEALLRGNSVPESLKQSVTSFKLGFGGEAVLMPGAYDYLYHPVVRWSYRNVFCRIARQPFIDKMTNWFRTR